MKRHGNLILLVLVMLLVALPLIFVRKRGPEGELFTGSDGQAKSAISTVAPGYRPWARAWLTPPSAEVEGLLFALQAALGAGFIGYYFGFRRGKASSRTTQDRRC